MPRWFVAILYALMFVCAALPASAQERAAEHSWQQAESLALEAGDRGDEGSSRSSLPADDGPLLILTEELQTDGMLEVPELFDGVRLLPISARGAGARPTPAEAVQPPPFLEGPQRPPRALALPAA